MSAALGFLTVAPAHRNVTTFDAERRETLANRVGIASDVAGLAVKRHDISNNNPQEVAETNADVKSRTSTGAKAPIDPARLTRP